MTFLVEPQTKLFTVGPCQPLCDCDAAYETCADLTT